MPKVKISEYSATANSNTDVASINIDEGCAPSGINNAIRAVMGHLKDFQQGTYGDPFNGPVNGTLGATTASTANVTTLTTSSTITHNGGTANGVAYLNGSKVLTTNSALVFDGTNLGIGTSSPTRRLTLIGDTTNYGIFTSNPSGYGGINLRSNTITSQVWSFIAQDNGSNSDLLLYGGASAGTKLTIDASGNLGIGTSSPGSFAAAGRNLVVGTGTGNNGLTIYSGNSSGSNIYFADGTTGAETYAGFIQYAHSTNAMLFGVNNTGSEAMTLNSSGNLLVGTTNSDPTFNRVNGAVITSGGAIYSRSTSWDIGLSSTSGTHITFYTDNGSARVTAGFISSNGATTLYNATSDYRLKENIQPMIGALAKVIQLKPVIYDWKDEFAGTNKHGEGFIAHELAEVCPHAVTGEKDAVDENGNPKYQGIDTSFLVATLTAAIQELKAEFDAYKASHP